MARHSLSSAHARPLLERDLAGFVLRDTYRLLRPIGTGGMSVVYEAEHLRLGHHVAVKLMAPFLVADRYALGRFRREAELASRLAHPHVVLVIDYDTTQTGEPYLVMELLSGEALDQRLQRTGTLPLPEVVRIVSQLCSALSVAHSQSVVHRDLKPSNVFLVRAPGEEPYAKLLDFGISKSPGTPRLTMARALVGTPEYMSPEQTFGNRDDIDGRSDQYSVALVAYEALSGQHPFCRDDPLEVLESVRRYDPPRLSLIAPEVPHAVAEVVARAMAKDPAERFADVQELARALEVAAEQAPRPSRTTLAPRKSGPRVSTRPPEPPVSERDARELVDGVRTALDARDLDTACRLAQRGASAMPTTTDPRALALLEVSQPLFEHVFAARIGGLSRRVAASSATGAALTPEEAFVLSRMDDMPTVEELLDVSALPRAEALRVLARLLDEGLARVA